MIRATDLTGLGWGTVDPRRLRVEHQGQVVPVSRVEVEDEAWQLIFTAEPFENVYTRQNVYFLRLVVSEQASPEIPLTLFPGETSTESTSLLIPIRIEENELYFPRALPGRTWYWRSLPAGSSAEFEFEVLDGAEGTAALEVTLFASTESEAADPDHHLLVFLNDQFVADQSWDGAGLYTLESEVPAGILQTGVNILRLETPGDTGVPAEIALLDYFDLYYSPKDRLGAGNGPGETISLNLVPAVLTPDLTSATNAADYIAIGPPDLLADLEPLLAHREEQGLQTMAVPLEAVYDQFAGGLAVPEAIRAFLQHARETWSVAPRYVLLVGDATYDPRGYQAPPEANRLPSFFVFTEHGGETVSDVSFAQLDEDDLPDLAVGRLPARTPEQVRTFVAKLLAYERQPPEDWQRRVLALADGQDAAFADHAQTFLDQFDGAYEGLLLAPPAGSTEAAAQIWDVLEEGVLFWSYFGHGSVTQLGKDGLFTAEDAAGLANARLAVMINMTCLAGLFSHPTVDSLSEAMLWNPDGGAIAALAATSLTVPADQQALSRALVEALLENPGGRLGDILLVAQRGMAVESAGAREVLETFLLFGDPALKLPSGAN